MKITNQIIAAASFSALLFAPLAQAQVGASDSDTKSITLEVIPAGVSITATDMSFGTVTPNADDGELNLVLACTGGTATTTFAGTTDPFGTPTCGLVTVESESSEDQNYLLKVDVESLENSEDSNVVINPTLSVLDQGGSNSVTGFTSGVAAPGAVTSGAIALAAGGTHIYRLGGSAPIAADQMGGTYSGNYTVTATIQ